jgi:hypothetical protein
VHDLPITFTILPGRWVGNTGCPAKSSTKGGHQWRSVHVGGGSAASLPEFGTELVYNI